MAGINTGDKLDRLTGKERLGAHRDSEYLGAEDIEPGTEPILTIEGIWWGEVTTARGKEKKDVMSFVEDTVQGVYNVRPLIVNSTNRKALKKLYKAVTAEVLQGKKIQIYIDHNVRDPETGGKTDGIRIRPFIPKEEEYICEACGKHILPASGMSPKQLAAYTMEKYGHQMCAECAKRVADAKRAQSNERPAAMAPAVEEEHPTTVAPAVNEVAQ